MKKRNQKLYECQTSGKKVLCGKFAEKMKSNYAVGDEDNNLILYNNLASKPIAFMNSQTSNVSALTSLTFACDDSVIIAGSNRGSLNVWDIQTSKISFCLKGHTIQVSSMYTDKNNSNIIATGSVDTNTKVWDLRTKNTVNTFKSQSKKINALSITPDSKTLVIGNEDGIVQTWQLRMQRLIFQYQIGSSVLNIDSTQNRIVVGSMDRLARIFNILAPFTLIGQTKNQTMPITNCIFYKQNNLFTAGTDNLKVWDLQEGIILTDNIETSSKGILHMTLNEKVQQIAFSGGSLSYHQCLFKEINFNASYQTPTIRYDSKQFQGSPIVNKNLSTLKRGKSINQPAQYLISNQRTKELFAKRTESISNTLAKNLSDVNHEVNDVLVNIKRVSQNFNNSKKQISSINNLMGSQHLKFMKIMGFRAKSMQTLLDHWSKGNFKYLIQQLRSIDIYVVSDALKQILAPSHYQISAQFAVVICERSKQMIFSKHNTLIKNGITYLLKIVCIFKDQLIKLKLFGCDKGVDLARQERLRRFDQMIEILIQVHQSSRIKKIGQKNDDMSNLAFQLQKELTLILSKVYGKNEEN